MRSRIRGRGLTVRAEGGRLRSAQARVGQTPAAQAQWVLGFATRNDLGRLRVAERAGLSWELAAFLGLTGPEDLAIGDHDVAECHQWIKAGVDQLVSGQRWRVHLDARSYVLDLSDRQWRPITPVSAPRAFRDRVIREILPVFGRRFRLCGRQKCPHPFIARKRKIYCDSRCSQTERTRRYRATHPDKSHEVYARQQRKKFGPNVVVRRRLSRSDRTSPGPKLL